MYVGSILFAENKPFYVDSISISTWKNIVSEEDIISTSNFGDKYVNLAIYPPQTFVVFYPFHFLSWKSARILWWIICILSLFVIGFCCFQWSKNVLWTSLIIGFSSTFFAFSLGQPLLLVLALIALTIYFKERPILSGVLFGLAFIKFGIAIPFALWFLIQKKFKLLMVAALCTGLLILPTVIQNPNVLSEYADYISSYYAFLYNVHPLNTYTFSNSELTIVLDYFYNQPISIWKKVNILGQLLGYGYIFILAIRKRISIDSALLGLLLVSFVFSYHLAYEPMAFLIPLALLNTRRLGLMVAFFIMFLSLPISRIAGDFLLLKFNYALVCCIALILFIFATLANKIERT